MPSESSSQGREFDLPEGLNIGRANIIRPSNITRRAYKDSISSRLRNLNPTGRSALERLVTDISKTKSISISQTPTSMSISLGAQRLNIPIFTRQGTMFHGASAYSATGHVFTQGPQGGLRKETLPHFLYRGATEALAATGPAATPVEKFRALKRHFGGFFANKIEVLEEGRNITRTAGTAARLFEPQIQVGTPFIRRGQFLRDTATMFVRSGTPLHSAIAQHQQALIELNSAVATKPRLGKFGTYGIQPQLQDKFAAVNRARETVLKEVVKIAPEGYTLLTGSQSGKWAFGMRLSERSNLTIPGVGNIGLGPNDVIPITLSRKAPENLMLYSNVMKAQVHHLQHMAFLPSPILPYNPGIWGGMSVATGGTNVTQSGPRSKSGYIGHAAGQVHAIVQPKGAVKAIKEAQTIFKGLPGHVKGGGTFEIPMNLMAIADPEISKMILGESGGILGEEWAAHALSRQHIYTRRIKIAPSGVDRPGLQVLTAALSDPIRSKLMQDIAESGEIERGGIYSYKPMAIEVGPKGTLGANLDPEGKYVSTVKARGASHKVVGYKYLKHTNELELALVGQRELRLAQSLVVGSTRIGASRIAPLRAISSSGRILRGDILADIPMVNITGGQIALEEQSLKSLQGKKLLEGPGDIVRFQIQSIAQRMKSNTKLFGDKGLQILAKSIGGRIKTMRDPYGGTQQLIEVGENLSWQTSMQNLERNIKTALGNADDATARRVFEEISGLQIAKMEPTLAKAFLSQAAKSAGYKPGSDMYNRLMARAEDITTFHFQGVPVGVRERMWEARRGRGSVKIRFDNLRLLKDTLAAAVTSGADSQLLTEYAITADKLMHTQNPAVYEELKQMTRMFYETPHGVKFKSVESFTPLPEAAFTARELPASQLAGTILEVDKKGNFKHRGFWTKTKEPLQLLGDGINSAQTKAGNAIYWFGPEAAGFSIDRAAGTVRLAGGPTATVSGGSIQRAYLELFNEAQAAPGGFEALAGSTIKGRLEAIYSTIGESAVAKSGAVRRGAIVPATAANLYQGYLPGLETGAVGIHKSSIREFLGSKERYEAFKRSQAQGQDFYIWNQRNPAKASSQLRVAKLIELGDQDIHHGIELGANKRALSQLNARAEEMVWTSRTNAYLSQADLDGDQRSLFLLSEDAKTLTKEQKSLARIWTSQNKQNEIIDKLLLEATTTGEFAKVGTEQYRMQVDTLTKQLEKIPGASKITGEMVARAYEETTRHGAIVPSTEVFFRSRLPVASEIARLSTSHATQQDMLTSLSKFSKEELRGSTLEILANLMYSNDRLMSGRNLAESYTHLNSLVGYASLMKAYHGSKLKPELGYGFLQKLQQTGASILNAGENTVDALLGQSKPIDQLTDMLYTMMGGDEIMGSRLPKKTQHFTLPDNILDMVEKNDKPALLNYLRRTVRSAVALEAFTAGAEYQNPAGFMFRESIEGASERVGGPLMEVAQYLHRDDDEARKALQDISADISDSHSHFAGKRAAHTTATEQTVRETLSAGSSVAARTRQTAELGLNAAQKIAQSRFFKPAAIALGALAGWEAIKSVVSGTPEPMASHTPSAPPPPSPLLGKPSDSTFDHNFLPQTNTARIQRVDGQKVRLNVSGKADLPVDFRSLSSTIIGSYGFQPVQNGIFRDARSDDLNRREVQQYIQARMNAAF